MSRSEFACLAALDGPEKQEMSQYEVYRACVATSNNGFKRPEEPTLSPAQQSFLEARRLIKQSLPEKARSLILSVEPTSELLRADQSFLLGTVLHRGGQPREAGGHYFNAATSYLSGKDERRYLRSLINSKICENDVQSYNAGSLFALEQQARRGSFHDLVGIIQMSKACELLSHGEIETAIVAANVAAGSLSLDGCPEDLAVARSVAAIGLFLAGNLMEAKAQFALVQLEGGKLTHYRNAYNALIAGKAPNLPQGHSLFNTPWSKLILKKKSIPGKILGRLRESPATADQLIEAVWGKDATHESYRNRLFVAIAKLRKNANAQIILDGERYRVA